MTDPTSGRQPHYPTGITRRDFLGHAGSGFGALALTAMLAQDGLLPAPAQAAEKADFLNPLAPKPVHMPAQAKSVIWLFMEGGPSHLETFDPKPTLQKLHGQPLPASYGKPITPMGVSNNTLLATKRSFKQYGECGMPVSDLYPNVAKHVDDIALIRSCWANGLNHVGSVCQMNTGSILAGRPSLGAWTMYGLGSENENLPGFVVLLDARLPSGGVTNWSTGFLPATYQGTQFRVGNTPILNLQPPASISKLQQRAKIDYLQALNQHFARTRQEDFDLKARIAAYELAYRMQAAAPEAVDLSKESESTKALYGMDQEISQAFGRNCLLARRLVERGVRFVQLYCGSGSQWDAHTDIEGNHKKMCALSDRPIAGLLTDLKQRGLLDSTLVLWGGEFGRTPMNEKTKGRDHNPYGFSMWMAGGGVKGGQMIGSTDEIGLFATEKRAHVHDIHATILRLIGMDHLRLTYLHNGRHERPTINAGQVIEEVLA